MDAALLCWYGSRLMKAVWYLCFFYVRILYRCTGFGVRSDARAAPW
jgi:hypothetical protein